MRSKPSKLNKEDVEKWFGSKENYVDYHAKEPDLKIIKHLIIED